MNEFPLITIITPSLNQGQFIEKTIKSVLDQNYPKIEYMIIDGGSRDNSIEVIRKYSPYISYWVSEPDQGQSNAINKGLRKSKGELLGWINADDIYAEGLIQDVVSLSHQQPDVDVFYGRLARIDKNDNVVPTPILPKDKIEFTKKFALSDPMVNQPGSFWRRRIMEKVGFLDETLDYCFDYEYWNRLVLNGAMFKKLNRVVAYFRLTPGSKTTSQQIKMAMELYRVVNSYYRIPNIHKQIGINYLSFKARKRFVHSNIFLHIAYGYFNQRKYTKVIEWLVKAIISNPFVLFQKKWFYLYEASLKRSVSDQS